MTMDTDEIEQAVEQRRVWLRGQLDAAAARFDVELVGEVGEHLRHALGRGASTRR